MNFLMGDARFFWPENINYFSGVPQAWDASLNTGIGQSGVSTLWITSYLYITDVLSHIGLSWITLVLIFWIFPIILLSFFSSVLLFRHLFITPIKLRFIAGIIYALNTYSIMNILGGQFGVMLAYSILPLVLLCFIKVYENPDLKNSLIAGLAISLQVLFDPRLVYISILIIGVYYLFSGSLKTNLKLKLVYVFFIPIVIIFVLHNYWILPLIYFTTPSTPFNYNSLGGFKFFSFAEFPYAISLLHPNWPDNIFGKVNFYKPEFMILPIIGFSVLNYLKLTGRSNAKGEKEKRLTLFFAFLLLYGAFLAKGVNEPLGAGNIFLFKYIPGMSLFRDPTKFYTIIAVAYSMLIPLAFLHLIETRLKKNKKYSIYIYILFTVSYLGILFSQLYNSNLKFFEERTIPQEYISFKNMIVNENEYFRTLWVPQWQRYGYFSDLNPAIGRGEVIPFASPISMAKELKDDRVIRQLQDLGVKYIVLPYDSLGEFFIDDRKYDEKTYIKTKLELDTNTNLSKKTNFGKVFVYELDGWKDRFRLISNSGIRWKANSATEYEIELENDKIESKLIFSDSFDPNWVAIWGDQVVNSKAFNDVLNSFDISKGAKHIKIYYAPQKLVNIGLILSGTSLFLILAVIAYLGKEK